MYECPITISVDNACSSTFPAVLRVDVISNSALSTGESRVTLGFASHSEGRAASRGFAPSLDPAY